MNKFISLLLLIIVLSFLFVFRKRKYATYQLTQRPVTQLKAIVHITDNSPLITCPDDTPRYPTSYYGDPYPQFPRRYYYGEGGLEQHYQFNGVDDYNHRVFGGDNYDGNSWAGNTSASRIAAVPRGMVISESAECDDSEYG